jgi:hypothetical protein
MGSFIGAGSLLNGVKNIGSQQSTNRVSCSMRSSASRIIVDDQDRHHYHTRTPQHTCRLLSINEGIMDFSNLEQLIRETINDPINIPNALPPVIHIVDKEILNHFTPQPHTKTPGHRDLPKETLGSGYRESTRNTIYSEQNPSGYYSSPAHSRVRQHNCLGCTSLLPAIHIVC